MRYNFSVTNNDGLYYKKLKVIMLEKDRNKFLSLILELFLSLNHRLYHASIPSYVKPSEICTYLLKYELNYKKCRKVSKCNNEKWKR